MYSDFEAKINYFFGNKNLLKTAFTHSSFSNENNNITNNERLEFLGDAVLELIISDFLFNSFSKKSEGDLTKFRATIVCEKNLSKVARSMCVGEHLKLGKGEHGTGGNDRDSILADAIEAIIGAIYLDGGIECAEKFVNEFIVKVSLEEAESLLIVDYKTSLQEVIQQNSKIPVVYKIIDESGPDHNKKFTVSVSHNDKILGTGEGRNKKEAEQSSAYVALNNLKKRK